MIAEKPKLFDFQKTYNRLESQLTELNTMLKENKRQTAEERFLAIKLETEIEIKNDLMEEYKRRIEENNVREKQESLLFDKERKIVYKRASDLKRNLRLSPMLKRHLSEILKSKSKNMEGKEEIAYFLALRKEVVMCNEYLKSQLLTDLLITCFAN